MECGIPMKNRCRPSPGPHRDAPKLKFVLQLKQIGSKNNVSPSMCFIIFCRCAKKHFSAVFNCNTATVCPCLISSLKPFFYKHPDSKLKITIARRK